MTNIEVYVLDKESNTKQIGQLIEFITDKSGATKAIVMLKSGEFIISKLENIKARFNKWNG